MFEGFTDRTIDFMWNIRFNNEKSWFEAHKNEYLDDFLRPMKELGKTVFDDVTEKYGDRGLVLKVSRIYRDARRLRGRGPYKDNLWLSLEKPSESWTCNPVFWFELTPEKWFYGMGYYMAKSETMAKLRARIDRDPKSFEKLIAPLAKQDEFYLDGDDYARRKTAPTEKTDVWYNKKSFSLMHVQPNSEELFSADFASRIAEGFKFLMPFYDYFSSLDSDPNPKGE